MGRPTIDLSDDHIAYLTEMAVENDGRFSADNMRAFKEKYPGLKISRSTLKRRYDEIWTSMRTDVQALTGKSTFWN